ncbi:unnamed protein product [Calicophoron daubneyi]|uniref:RING-type domain-containing protein n=1 Tax=Calicophoron daubneyi TaxID=300641 RepID=A0AAV2T6F7_CALDB
MGSNHPVEDQDWNYEISPEYNNLFCPICLSIFKNAVRSSCGHLFCRDCIDEHFHRSNSFWSVGCECPICRTVWTASSFTADHETRLAVDRLCVTCKICNRSVNYCDRAEHRSYCPGNQPQDHDRTICDLCDQVLDSPSDRRSHWQNCPKTNLAACSCCGNYVHKSLLYEHERFCGAGSSGPSPWSPSGRNSSPGPHHQESSISPLEVIGITVLGVVVLGLLVFIGVAR